jgi:hypothetical protein
MKNPKKTARPEVVSLRVSEARLELLERYRRAFAATLGREVSLSEAAFMALDDRATGMDRTAARVELLKTPTDSLAQIRKRWDAQHALSAVEWDVLAEYVQIGADEERQEPPVLRPAVPSRASYLNLLVAFDLVYSHRKKPASPHTWAYYANLGGYETQGPLNQEDADQRDDDLLTQMDHRRDRLERTHPTEPPGNIGHCFLTAIREEGVESATLDRLLAPHWNALWGLAARGHWIRHGRQPVRLAGEDDLRHRMSLPGVLTSGDLRMSFAPAGRFEFATQIEIVSRGLTIVINEYSELMEFRAMLDAAHRDAWTGRYLRTALSQFAGSPTRKLYLKRSEISVEVSESEWTALRDLVAQAWNSGELQRWLVELYQEYGEQG